MILKEVKWQKWKITKNINKGGCTLLGNVKSQTSKTKDRWRLSVLNIFAELQIQNGSWHRLSLLLHQTNLVFKDNLSLSDANNSTGITIIYIIWSTGLCFTHWIFLLFNIAPHIFTPTEICNQLCFFLLYTWTICTIFFLWQK